MQPDLSRSFEDHKEPKMEFTRHELSIICHELWHIINDVLEHELGTVPGETCEETIALWRTNAKGFCRTLVMRGWSLADAEFVTGDKTRLADMLEQALEQRSRLSTADRHFRQQMLFDVEKQPAQRERSISLL